MTLPISLVLFDMEGVLSHYDRGAIHAGLHGYRFVDADALEAELTRRRLIERGR